MALKIGIVGVGNVAVGNYLPYLSKQPDVELGYFNRTHEKAVKAAGNFGGKAFASLQDFAGWDPDAALILTREMDRYEVSKKLIELGVRGFFFEKPLVAEKTQAKVDEGDFVKAREVLTLAQKKGSATAMQFNYRFFDQTLLAKKLIAERNLGKVIQVNGLAHFACWTHCIDLFQYFAGNVSEVTGLLGTTVRSGQGIEAPDVAATFRTEGGALGTFIGTAGVKWQHPLFEITFTFENGRIHMRDIDGDLELLDGTRQSHETFSQVRDKSRWDHYNTSFHKSLAAYLDSLRHHLPPPVPGLDGLRQLQFEAALKKSIASGRPVLTQKEFSLDF